MLTKLDFVLLTPQIRELCQYWEKHIHFFQLFQTDTLEWAEINTWMETRGRKDSKKKRKTLMEIWTQLDGVQKETGLPKDYDTHYCTFIDTACPALCNVHSLKRNYTDKQPEARHLLTWYRGAADWEEGQTGQTCVNTCRAGDMLSSVALKCGSSSIFLLHTIHGSKLGEVNGWLSKYVEKH